MDRLSSRPNIQLRHEIFKGHFLMGIAIEAYLPDAPRQQFD